MYNEYHYKRPNWRELVDSLYEVLRQYLVAFMEEQSLSPYVEQVQREIIRHLSDPDFDVAAALAAVPYHPNYFRELFARELGSSPNQYLTAKRMAYGEELLRTRGLSGYSIAEIALLCGYPDPYYFSRVFRQHIGVSPRAWLRAQAASPPG